MKGIAAGIDGYRNLIFIEKNTQRIFTARFRHPLEIKFSLHAPGNGLFHNSLDIGRAEKFTVDGGCFLNPAFGILRKILFPGDFPGTLEQFIESHSLETSYF